MSEQPPIVVTIQPPESFVVELSAQQGPVGAQGFKGNKGDTGDTGAPGTTFWNGLEDKPDSFPPSDHEHAINDVTGLESTLGELAISLPGHAWISESGNNATAELGDPRKPFATANAAATAGALYFHFGPGTWELSNLARDGRFNFYGTLQSFLTIVYDGQPGSDGVSRTDYDEGGNAIPGTPGNDGENYSVNLFFASDDSLPITLIIRGGLAGSGGTDALGNQALPGINGTASGSVQHLGFEFYAKDVDPAVSFVQWSGFASKVDLSYHTNNYSNPHLTTKAQVGLGNVENAAASALYIPKIPSSVANRMVRTVAGGNVGLTGITIDDSNSVSGMGTLSVGSGSTSGFQASIKSATNVPQLQLEQNNSLSGWAFHADSSNGFLKFVRGGATHYTFETTQLAVPSLASTGNVTAANLIINAGGIVDWGFGSKIERVTYDGHMKYSSQNNVHEFQGNLTAFGTVTTQGVTSATNGNMLLGANGSGKTFFCSSGSTAGLAIGHPDCLVEIYGAVTTSRGISSNALGEAHIQINSYDSGDATLKLAINGSVLGRLDLLRATSQAQLKSANGLQIKTLDGTADAPLSCSNLTASGTVIAPMFRFDAGNGNTPVFRMDSSAQQINITRADADWVDLSLKAKNLTASGITTAPRFRLGFTNANTFINENSVQIIGADGYGGKIGTTANIGFYTGGETTDAATERLRITFDGNIVAYVPVTSAYQSSASDPSGSDIPAGSMRAWLNTSSNLLFLAANVGGTIRKAAFT